MDVYEVIVRPLVTEKTAILQSPEPGKGNRQYVFCVNANANKIQIQSAVETIYGVKVESVNVMNMPAKMSRVRGRRPRARRPVWKKAVVTVRPGERIEALEA